MAEIKIFNPDTMGKPLGPYSQITRVKASEFVFIGEQVYANIKTALDSVGAGWRNVVEFTTYMVHSQDIPKFMAYRKRAFPGFFPDGNYPPNTLLIIDRLVQEPLLIEVQTVAAL